jgi:methylated-DNA-[protein]-cysteine S-methyltransferase
LNTKHLYNSPIGEIQFECSETHLKQMAFVSEKNKDVFTEPSTALAKKIIRSLEDYFLKKQTFPSIPLELQGTSFQKAVWKLLANIPIGESKTYAEIAALYGNPKGVRAVGTALGKNPVLIVLPCHRILGSYGALTGYAGGLEKKRWLLEHEGYPIQKTLAL